MYSNRIIRAAIVALTLTALGTTAANSQGQGNPGGATPPQIDEVIERIENLETDVSALEVDVDALQSAVGSTQDDVMTLANDFTTLQGEVEDVDLRLLDIEVQLGQIAQSRIVFVTSDSFTGNLGGLEGADQKCQDAATDAGLDGIYLAWLSTYAGPILGTPVTDPASRFIRHNQPYVLVNGTQVADHWADLADGTLDHAIDRTEFDVQLFAGNFTWSTTSANGRAAAPLPGTTCNNWTTDGVATFASFLGTVGATDFMWSAPGAGIPEACLNEHRLICVQQ